MTAAAWSAMPGHVDLGDVTPWVEHAGDLVAGPPGCREWTGRATWDWALGRFGAAKGEAVVAGRTVDGAWGTLLLWPRGEHHRSGDRVSDDVFDVDSARVVPLVGNVDAAVARLAEGGAAVGVGRNAAATAPLRSALAALSTPGPGDWVEWDEARRVVVLHRSLPAGRRWAEASVTFPDGGTAPSAVDVVFPSFRAASRRVRSAEVHVVGGDAGWTESFVTEFAVRGVQGRGTQTVTWSTSTACPPSP